MFTRRFLKLPLLLVLIILLNIPTKSQDFSKNIKATASQRAMSNEFGTSVAISGKTALVGAPNEWSLKEHEGTAYIFTLNEEGTWQETQQLLPSDRQEFSHFGQAVAINGDVLAISAIEHDQQNSQGEWQDDAGTVFIFKKDQDGVWTEVQQIFPSIPYQNDLFGYSLAIEKGTIFIGASGHDETTTNTFIENTGIVYVFEQNTMGQWEETQQLMATDKKRFAGFGNSIAMNGNTAIIGAHAEAKELGDNQLLNDAGAVYLFEKNVAGQWVETQKLSASEPQAYANFGRSVSISGDIAIVGASSQGLYRTTSSVGDAYIFEKNSTGHWEKTQQFTETGDFGRSVFINHQYALIGAPSDNSTTGTNERVGAAYLYEKDQVGNWTKQHRLTAKDGKEYDFFGTTLALTNQHAIIGAFGQSSDANGQGDLYRAGAVYFFENQPTISNTLAGLTNQTQIPITIDFHTAVSGFDLEDLEIENASISLLSTTNQREFTGFLIPNTDLTIQTTLSVRVRKNTVIDAFGVANTASNTFNIDYYPQSNRLSGRVYQDKNGNCQYDAGIDLALANYLIQNRSTMQYTQSRADGTYELLVGTGNHEVAAVISNLQGQLIEQNCQTKYQVQLSTTGNDMTNLDFPLSISSCPILRIDVASSRRRRCVENITTVTYRNEGAATAEQAKIHLKMPEYLDFISADVPHTIDQEGYYVFDVGTVAPNTENTIRIQALVPCIDNITGLDQCVEAWITPANTCLANLLPNNPNWDESSLQVEGTCLSAEEGTRFVIRNVGDGDMSSTRTYRIYENALLAGANTVQLASGDSLVLAFDPFAGSIRVEVEQSIGHPGNSRPQSTVTGCHEGEIAHISTANLFLQDDAAPERDIDCAPIVDSFDPNDKMATPLGFSENRYVAPQTPLTYRIRFQNTGTDTAYRVVVVDTISNLMDMSTFRMGTSDHQYQLEISGDGQPVLTWVFEAIDLVDSLTDEPNSHGFITFSIAPKADLPNGTIVHNEADIYFDFNSPIRTNDAWVNYYDTLITTNDYVFGSDMGILTPTIVTSLEEITDLESETLIGPNPTSEQLWVSFPWAGNDIKKVQVIDVTGKVLMNKQVTNQEVKLDVRSLQTGTYLVRIVSDNGNVVKRFVKR